MFVSMKPILEEATKKGYGVVAPSIFDALSIEFSFKKALALRSPIILNTGGPFDLKFLTEVAKYYSNKYPEVPVALNLDHGDNFDQIMTAIRAGFSSVMLDRSSASFEDNVKETAEVVRAAHIVGVSVEAELGHVGMGLQYDDSEDNLTRVEDAVKFVELTGVDFLAVAIGTAHGHYKGTPKINFQRLDEIRKAIDIPLVLHGGSSSGDDNLQKSIKHGISKINIGTDLRDAAVHAMTDYLSDYDPHKRGILNEIFRVSMDAYANKLEYYIKLFGSNNRW
ncbi:class II fructose-bisphosphate aldolase [Clostridium polynesiense]|uniref:class II fructose-bisphosphate aldolase n=1 Tax=Clostridium polynesiense TaxID=1325933 RepID=UPI00058D0D3E|nr:class II fructose-bisphosphate aldolase [Clostridium polynesiense]